MRQYEKRRTLTIRGPVFDELKIQQKLMTVFNRMYAYLLLHYVKQQIAGEYSWDTVVAEIGKLLSELSAASQKKLSFLHNIESHLIENTKVIARLI